MDKRHQEYIDYYKSRMLKYKDNPMYGNSYQTEKNLYDAISTASSLDEFGKILNENNLAVRNAIALSIDKETARKIHFEEIKEFIRAKAPIRILEIIDSVKTDTELIQKSNEIESAVSIEISVDLFTDIFYSDFDMLENIEVWETAEVPEEWRKDLAGWINDTQKEGKESWEKDVLPNARNWNPDWTFNFDLIFEERHRRKIPVSNEIVKKRIEQFKKYRGL
ncbi:MAG: hypothetical protein JW917_04530 [Ignavibacteria bacterium]|nr:hypothetical protein [Ignavibacteria bacterium]